MWDKVIVGLVTALVNGIFRKKMYVLWAIKYKEKNWTKIWKAPKRLLMTMEPALFGQGWRTLILEDGIDPPPVEIAGQVVY